MRLRSVNVTKRRQDADHAHDCESARRLHDRRYADRDGDAPHQIMNRALHRMGPDLPAPKRRDVGSAQGVMVLRPLTIGDTMHPEARAMLDADELAEVVDENAEATLDPELHRHVDRIEGGLHKAMVGYQLESQEKAMAAHEKKLAARAAKMRRRAERAGEKVETDAVVVDEADRKRARDQAEKFAQQHREQAAETEDRLRYGFYAPRGFYAGDEYEALHEFLGEGLLRSHLDWTLARFAQITPRKGRIRAGYTKEALLETATKLIALDCPYVELDTKRMCCIVVEFDTVWASAASFRQALLTLLPARMLPNLIVGRQTRDGLFARPHCIWYLNPCVLQPDGSVRDSSVMNDLYREWTDPDTGELMSTGNPDCRPGPIRKFQAVQRGLVAHLLPLGADPGCWNIWKPKNPLSPFWSVLISNSDFAPQLDDFIGINGFSMDVDEADLARRGAVMRAEAADTGAEIRTPSNQAWATVGQVIEPMVAIQLKIRDLSFLDAAHKGVETLTRWFDDRVRPQVEDELQACLSLDRILEGRCRFAANYCIDRMERRAGRHAHAFKTKSKAKPAGAEAEPTGPKKKRNSRPVNRGRDDSLKFKQVTVDGVTRPMTQEERFKARSERSGATRHAVSLWRMCQVLCVTGLSVETLRSLEGARKAAVIKDIGLVSKSFAYDNWDEALALLSADSADMHKDKKITTSPASSIDPSSSNQGAPELVDCLGGSSTSWIPANHSDPILSASVDEPPDLGQRDRRRSTSACVPVGMPVDVVSYAAEPVLA